MWALVLVSFTTFGCIISAALAVHILWQRMSCLHPFLLAAVTMITSEKAASRGGIFQKSLTPFSPTCLRLLNVIDSDSRLQTTRSVQKNGHNLQCHVSTSQSHNPAGVPISWSSPLQLPTTLAPGEPTSPRQRLPSCPGTRFRRGRWSLPYPHIKLKSKLLTPKKPQP